MIVTALHTPHLPGHAVHDAVHRARTEPASAAFLLLRIGFAVLPIWMGVALRRP